MNEQGGIIKWRFGRICKKNATQIILVLPHKMWAGNNKNLCHHLLKTSAAKSEEK